MEHPTEPEHLRLVKIATLTADELGWEIVDLIRTALELHRFAMAAWLAAGPPDAAQSLPEVQLYEAGVAAVASALRQKFSGTPLGPSDGPDVSGALWLITSRLAESAEQA